MSGAKASTLNIMDESNEPAERTDPLLDDMVDDPEDDEFGYIVPQHDPPLYGDDDEA